MDLYQLKYFLEVSRELSFTRAADNLGISPSAVSRSVALLERSVRKKLFARSKRHVALTVFGDALKARAEKIFDEVEGARLELAGEDQAPPLLRVGSREMITNYLFPGPLADFKARYGETRFGIYTLEPGALAEALKKDRVDLGFHYNDNADPALESRLLGRLRSHVYASKTYLKRTPLKGLRDVLAQPFIAPRSFGAGASSPSPDGFPDQKHPRKIQYEAEFLETHRKFVLSGLCVGVLPDLVMAEELKRGEVVALEGPPLHRDIYWFRRRNRVLPKAVDFFIAGIRRTIQEIGDKS
jgi:DNA-binding transcriptional LysR family regulator